MADDLTRLNFHTMEMTLYEGTVVPIHSVRDERGLALDCQQLRELSGTVDIVAGPAPNGEMLEFSIQLSHLN